MRRIEAEERVVNLNANRQLSLYDFPQETLKEFESSEQPYNEEHNWQSTRYAGVAMLFAPLFKIWKWMDLAQGFLGCNFKIMLVFL